MPSILLNGMCDICLRKSGPQSRRMRFPSVSTKTDVRSRLSRGSVLVHTGHVQPVSGTPVDVPVPRNVIFILFGVFEDRIIKLHKFYFFLNINFR